MSVEPLENGTEGEARERRKKELPQECEKNVGAGRDASSANSDVRKFSFPTVKEVRAWRGDKGKATKHGSRGTLIDLRKAQSSKGSAAIVDELTSCNDDGGRNVCTTEVRIDWNERLKTKESRDKRESKSRDL
jgi:hypothetical protein